jgi:hypothetical protein
VMTPGRSVAGRVGVEVGKRIARRMIRLPSGESLGGEPNPNPLGLWFVESGVGEGGSTLWNGIAGRSMIERSIVPLVRGSTVDDPFFLLLL